MFNIFKFFFEIKREKASKDWILLWDTFNSFKFSKSSIPSKVDNLLQLKFKYVNLDNLNKVPLTEEIWLFDKSNFVKFIKLFKPFKFESWDNFIWRVKIDFESFILLISWIWLNISLSLA